MLLYFFFFSFPSLPVVQAQGRITSFLASQPGSSCATIDPSPVKVAAPAEPPAPTGEPSLYATGPAIGGRFRPRRPWQVSAVMAVVEVRARTLSSQPSGRRNPPW